MGKIVFRLSLLGATDDQMADALNIATSTLNLWKNEHPEFMDQIRKGRTEANGHVAKAMYKRAKGFSYEEVTIENEFVRGTNETGEEVITERPKSVKRVKKLVPADVTAGKFWLTNKQPEQWADKAEVKATNTNINMSVEPTPEEAQKIKEMLDKSI
jgi:hypothetical protein